MSEIKGQTILSIDDFVANIYDSNKQSVLFWDTCSLLEIIRFIYRNGDVNSYRILNKINGLIQSNTLHSVASELTITEWNNHQEQVKNDFEKSLIKTGEYHKNCIETINEINTFELNSEAIHDKNLLTDLGRLADDIITKTHFIQTDEIANKALKRVELKIPPASKKNEFKDCSVWETMVLLSERINAVNSDTDIFNKIFYSVNTDDFVDKSRAEKRFYANLLTESSMMDFICCSKLDEVNTRI